MLKVSIIIVTYNSSGHIYDCLNSIIKYNDLGDKLEILVVDNASNEQDEVFQQIQQRYKGRVLTIDSGKNGGYGYGNNIGIKKTSADIIIVMNPDVRIEKSIFSSIEECFNDPSLGMMGVNFIDGTPAFYLKRGYSLLDALLYKIILRIGHYNPETMYMSGSFLCFRRDAILKAGLFDENIFMYSEEADITNRILSAGYKVCLRPEIMVRHLAHDRKFNPVLNNIRMESGLYYEKKYGIDPIKTYRTEVKILKLKRFAACILNRKDDRERLHLYLKELMRFYNKHVFNANTL